MLERMEEQAYEECDEAAESWNISCKEGRESEQEELYKGVQALVETYFDKIGEKPNFYKVGNIRTIRA